MSLDLPIWRRKLRAEVQEAEARWRAEEQSHQDTANRLAADLALALYGIADAKRKTSLYRDTLIPKEEEALFALLTAYQAGTADYIDLIQSQRALLEFQLVFERARTDRLIHFWELQALVGKPLSSRMGTAEETQE